MSEADGYVELLGKNRVHLLFHGHPQNSGLPCSGQAYRQHERKKKDVLFSICACHPCAGAMLWWWDGMGDKRGQGENLRGGSAGTRTSYPLQRD